MEAVEIGTFKCSQSECSISTTGKCVNGLNPTECTNKIPVKKEERVIDEQVPTPNNVKTMRLQWGESFKEAELAHITYRYPCKLILAVGEPYVGKSTLYAALFDSFHQGGCGDLIFASSKTPIGFERICHYAREKCKGNTPDTERTKSHEFSFLHLSVRKKDLSEIPQHLVFADVNGEIFQNAKNSDEEITKLSLLKRADHIFFIADGGLLIKNAEKHIVKDDVTKMLQRCLQNNMLNSDQGVHLIVTKWDQVNAAGKTKTVDEFFIQPILKQFSSVIENIIPVASRSVNEEIPSRFGLDTFLNICLSTKSPAPREEFKAEIQRQFQRFKYEEKL